MAIRRLFKITRILSNGISTGYIFHINNFHGLEHWRCLVSSCQRRNFHIESQPIKDEVTVSYQTGLPILTVPLPSRKEKCQFTLRPVSSTVGDFIEDVQKEDRGIDRISVYTTDRVRVASSTSIENLMQNNFHLIINDLVFLVSPPESGRITSEEMKGLDHVRCQVAKIYEVLNVEEYQISQEKRILSQLEILKTEIEPFEKKKNELMAQAKRKTLVLSWLGLGLMGMQFGILARLTWWEYSWDIMEPVTYFITYGTSMALYAYFVLTRNEYIMPDVCDRHSLLGFHKQANKQGLNVYKYNTLRNAIAQKEYDLERLRDPLQAHLPIKEIPSKSQS